MTAVRLGTRASKLAVAQSGMVADLLRTAHPGLTVELIEITTAGDRDQSSALSEGVGWFTTAIQDALRRRDIDLAVHSFKDLPTGRPPGLAIGAIPMREDPRDALISRTGASLAGLPRGAVVGTSSPRREAQLRATRPDLVFRPIRGNVDTRLSRVRRGEYDATVLAVAGLKRLGLEREVAHVFDLDEMLPAPAQGALAVECRSDDERVVALLDAIDDPALRPPVEAERSFLATLEAGCSFPAAAHAMLSPGALVLDALVAPAGPVLRQRTVGPGDAAARLGATLAAELMRAAGMHAPAG